MLQKTFMLSLLKKGLSLSCTLRFSNKDIVQNLMPGSELENQFDIWLGSTFKIATLICTEEESVLLFNNKNKAQMSKKQTDIKESGTYMHNKGKNYLIKEDTEFLKLLSVSSKEAKVLSDQQDKYRQINKYCEILLSQLEDNHLLNKSEDTLRIVDMGSGKGYLTFALYYLLKEKMQLKVEILGIELREELCKFCNEQAKKLGWSDNLRFAAMDIRDFNKSAFDVLIALHACDTATDVAISQGIVNGAKLVVVAPCCHKQIRKQMKPKAPWNNILKNGILMEREAELLTDAIRALLLEREGYKTKVFEFISGEHTPKNLMITAGRHSQKLSKDKIENINLEIAELKAQFGIEEHYLESLL
jgi:SAM-dependent methyltransferase